MNIKKISALVALALATTVATGTAYAELNDKVLRKVTRVDVDSDNNAYIWVSPAVPIDACSAKVTSGGGIRCTITEKWCEQAVSVALAAYLSGHSVEFSPSCGWASGKHVFHDFERLRIEDSIP